MQSTDKIKNLTKITNALRICQKIIKCLFLIEIKFYKFSEHLEINEYYTNEVHPEKYHRSLELNQMIILFFKYKKFSYFCSLLDESQEKLFIDFLKQVKILKNKLFHDELYLLSEADLVLKFQLYANALNLIDEKYSKYKIVKENYKEYLSKIINS